MRRQESEMDERRVSTGCVASSGDGRGAGEGGEGGRRSRRRAAKARGRVASGLLPGSRREPKPQPSLCAPPRQPRYTGALCLARSRSGNAGSGRKRVEREACVGRGAPYLHEDAATARRDVGAIGGDWLSLPLASGPAPAVSIALSLGPIVARNRIRAFPPP